GTNGTANQADTWEWDGNNWQQAAPANTPPIRQRHGLTYDSVHGFVVLFGGSNGTTRYNDIWKYDGVNWQQATTPPVAPAVRDRPAVAFDPVRARTVLFGGRGP